MKEKLRMAILNRSDIEIFTIYIISVSTCNVRHYHFEAFDITRSFSRVNLWSGKFVDGIQSRYCRSINRSRSDRQCAIAELRLYNGYTIIPLSQGLLLRSVKHIRKRILYRISICRSIKRCTRVYLKSH